MDTADPTIHSINLAPRSSRLYAREIETLAEAYLADLARRRQQKTAAGYRIKLGYFLDWWRSAGPGRNFLLGADDLIEFARHLETVTKETGETIGFHSRNDALRRLRQMLRWAFTRGYVPVDYSAEVPPAPGGPPAHRPLDLDTLAAILEAAHLSSQPRRNQAIIAVLAGTGARCEEAAAIQIEQVTSYADQSGLISLTLTKNDDPRLVAFDAATGAYLCAWLDALPPKGPLFPSRTGGMENPLTPSGIYKIVLGLATDAGVRSQIRGPHDLRRMFATQWSRKLRGESYGQLLQKQLGHASWATTQRYSLQDSGDILDVMRQEPVSPMAQLGQRRSPRRALPLSE